MQSRQQYRRAAAVVMAAAATAAAGVTARAAVSGGSGQEFIISTSGATALSAFTRAGDGTTFNRGPYSLGQPTLQIGGSTYTLDANGQRLGRAVTTSGLTNEPPLTADRFVYTYHEIGLVNGVNDVAQDGGLLPINPAIDAFASGNPFWHVGTRLNSAPANGTVLSNGYTFTGKQPVRIAWSDVRAEQAFGVPGGTASPSARPTLAGYGQGRALTAGGTNHQALTSAAGLVGGLGAATTRLRNESVAVVPFTISANPGTGLSKITEEDARWLQAVGRLPNGANFNSVTRDVGSGTRNQGANNLLLDPSWASGERDRLNPDGTERSPFSFNNNDDRPSLTNTSADKTSGSSRLRPTVQFGRMNLGILSSGDVGGRGRGTGGIEPLRVLAIDWNSNDYNNDDNQDGTADAPLVNGQMPDAGFTQPTLDNVLTGKYRMWSAAQAVTVAPDAVATVDAANPNRPIQGDTIDHAGSVGTHRKFLDNIRNSVANFGNPESNQTPFDAIIAASFIPTQIMGVDKPFDGDAQSIRTRTAVEQSARADARLSGLQASLAWADPASMNGNLADTGLRYNVFAPGNNLAAATQVLANGVANLSIDIEPRTVLAGDFDGDNVRDLKDVEALAMAYAAPQAYLATGTIGGALNSAGLPRNYNGAEVASLETATVSRSSGTDPGGATVNTGTLTFTAGQEGLVVLSDFNSNGNITPTTGGDGTVASVEGADARYFLYGAAVDTGGFSNRMGDGIRLGQLKKNEGITRFNAELDKLATDGVISQVQADTLKFNKFDVNNDGVASRADARYVDRNVGKNFTVFSDVMSTFDDLVAAELNDNGAITHTLSSGDSDMKQMVFHLQGRDVTPSRTGNEVDAINKLLNGDANFDGVVGAGDFNLLATNFGLSNMKWSAGDFNFDGVVGAGDFNLLATTFGLSLAGGRPGLTAQDWSALESFGESIGSPVPEPGAAAIVILGGIPALLRRRRRD